MQAANVRDEGAAPRFGRTQMLDLCAGLLGVQVVWGLQNANTSRIFQTLGADVASLPLLWIAAPVTGLLIQPLVGHWSDRHAGRWGRRKPFIAAGTVLTAFAMLLMSGARSLGAAVLALWLLTAAVNVAMQPFRALAADAIPLERRAGGFALQVCFIGAGAVFASALPWLLANVFGVAGTAPPGVLPPSIRLAFQIGAATVLAFVGWTLVRSPDRLPAPPVGAGAEDHPPPRPIGIGAGIAWLATGCAIAIAAGAFHLRRETWLLAAMTGAYGALRLLVAATHRRGARASGVLVIVEEVASLPVAMRRLAATQFLTWLALFTMWIYTVPVVAARQFGATAAAGDRAYAAAGDWVGILFATYDAIAVAAALSLPWVVRRLGLGRAHAACLALGTLGLAGLVLIDRPALLLLPALGIGVAWASVLSTPYVIVANVAPPGRAGLYMGIHNMFLVVPQLVAASTLGVLVDYVLHGRPQAMLGIAAAAMALAALSALVLPTDHAVQR